MQENLDNFNYWETCLAFLNSTNNKVHKPRYMETETKAISAKLYLTNTLELQGLVSLQSISKHISLTSIRWIDYYHDISTTHKKVRLHYSRNVLSVWQWWFWERAFQVYTNGVFSWAENSFIPLCQITFVLELCICNVHHTTKRETWRKTWLYRHGFTITQYCFINNAEVNRICI